MDEIANLQFESMSKEEIWELYKFGRIQCETKRKLDKQRLIEAVNDMRADVIQSKLDRMITHEYRVAFDDACLEFQTKIDEAFPD
jgi:hypothetical protein